MSFRGQASSAKMMTLGGKLTALACHPTKKVNKQSNQPISMQILDMPTLTAPNRTNILNKTGGIRSINPRPVC